MTNRAHIRSKRRAILYSAPLLLVLWMCTRDARVLSGPETAVPEVVPSMSEAAVAGGSTVLVGAGNVATCSGNDDERVAAILDTVPGTVFMTGNGAYPNGTDVAYSTCFDPATTWGRHKARIRPAPGDQDYGTPGATGYFNYFGAAAGEAGSGYYSYDLGSWHVVVLNSSIAVTAGSAQEQWLRADLAANGKPCTLAYWQLPLFSSGQSGSFSKVRPLWQALYEFGADVIINGKDRDYERFAPQDPHGNADPSNGIRQFVVGTGGAGNSTSFRSTIKPNSEVRYLAAAGLLKLTLNATSYSWLFIPVKGLASPDGGTANCSGTHKGPSASAGGPHEGAEGSAIAFDGSASSDPEGDALTYDWDFGDGSQRGSGATPTHTYGDNGTYTVTLTVSDGKGGSATASTMVTVSNVSPTATLAAPSSVAEGGEIALELTGAVDAGAADVSAGLRYAFDCGTGAGYGEFAAAASVTCPAADDGGRTVKASVRDKDGATTEYTATVEVANAAPVVETFAGPAEPVAIGAAATVRGTFTDAGTADTHAATIDWGDGHSESVSVTQGSGSGTAGGTHTYTASGVYTVTLTVIDDNGGEGRKTTQVAVNGAPVIESLNGPYAAAEGSAVTLTATATDPDGGAVTFEWDFGDGSPRGNGPSTSHTYADNGTYTVTLTVSNGRGGSSSASTTVTVSNAPPVVDAGAAASIVAGRSFSQNGTFSDVGTADGPWRYHLDWGDGSGSKLAASVSAQGALPTRSYAYAEPGTYTLTARVTDKDGGVGVATRTITVSPNEVPVAVINGPHAADEGAPINFSSAGTSDGNGDVLRYKWDFGDGTTSTSANFTKRYADNGTYTVTLTVTDPSNASSTATTTAVITNVAPTAVFVAPTSVNEGSAYTLSLTGQDAGTADRPTLEYAFDCGSGVYGAWSTTVKSVTCPAHPDELEMPLTLRGKVRDKDGAEVELTKVAKVVDVVPAVVFTATSPISIIAGGSVSFQGSFADPGVDDGPWTWHLNWGDGTPVATGVVTQPGDLGTFTHPYSKAGTFSAFLRVTDREGKTKSTTVVITVSP